MPVSNHSHEAHGIVPNVETGSLSLAPHRILASKVFERTHRLSELLGYLAEQTGKGDLQALKEAVIGQKVFGRQAAPTMASSFRPATRTFRARS